MLQGRRPVTSVGEGDLQRDACRMANKQSISTAFVLFLVSRFIWRSFSKSEFM